MKGRLCSIGFLVCSNMSIPLLIGGATTSRTHTGKACVLFFENAVEYLWLQCGGVFMPRHVDLM